MKSQKYNYLRPSWCKPNSERDIEMSFFLNLLYDISTNSEATISLLDVGFAGAGYIEMILENFKNVKYIGLDGDSGRIQGHSLQMIEKPQAGFYSKEEWNKVLANIDYIKSDIIDYVPFEKYDVVMSISVIEHIVPLGYDYGNDFYPNKDMVAIVCMKQLVASGGYLLLTFPCGVERIFSPQKGFEDKLKNTPLEGKFMHGRHDILIYDRDRIDGIIGSWEVVKENYWVDNDDGVGFKKCDKEIARSYEHETSDVKSLCTLLLKKG